MKSNKKKIGLKILVSEYTQFGNRARFVNRNSGYTAEAMEMKIGKMLNRHTDAKDEKTDAEMVRKENTQKYIMTSHGFRRFLLHFCCLENQNLHVPLQYFMLRFSVLIPFILNFIQTVSAVN